MPYFGEAAACSQKGLACEIFTSTFKNESATCLDLKITSENEGSYGGRGRICNACRVVQRMKKKHLEFHLLGFHMFSVECSYFYRRDNCSSESTRGAAQAPATCWASQAGDTMFRPCGTQHFELCHGNLMQCLYQDQHTSIGPYWIPSEFKCLLDELNGIIVYNWATMRGEMDNVEKTVVPFIFFCAFVLHIQVVSSNTEVLGAA